MSDLLDVVAGPLVSGGLDLLGGVMQMGGQQASAQKAMDFSERMSSTAFQRARADMEAAHLNPAMMYGSGGAESAPGGVAVNPPNVMAGVSSSAMDVFRLQNETKQVNASVDLQKSQADLAKVNAALGIVNTQGAKASLPEKQAQGDIYKNHPWVATVEKLLNGVGEAVAIGTGASAIRKLLSGTRNSAGGPTAPGVQTGSDQYFGGK